MNALITLLLTAAPAPNLYDLQLTLVDQTGKTVKLDTFRGQPVLISMFYGTCTSACPLLVARVKALEQKLSATARANTRVLLVSLDPDRDTPAGLQQLAATFNVHGRWALTRTSTDSVQQLAAALGIRYRFLANGMISHSSVLTLLDASGAIVSRVDGLEAPLNALTEALEGLAAPSR